MSKELLLPAGVVVIMTALLFLAGCDWFFGPDPEDINLPLAENHGCELTELKRMWWGQGEGSAGRYIAHCKDGRRFYIHYFRHYDGYSLQRLWDTKS